MTLSEDGMTVQGPPSAPEYPALQMQAVEAVLSAGEPEFAGQPSQLAFPLPVLNVSATHLVHTPSRPEDPALHMQAARAMLPAGESAFAGQLLQALAAFAAENVPDGQFVQELAVSAYLPAAHLSQLHGPHSHEIAYPCRHTQSSLETLAKGEAEFAGHPVHASEVVDRASGLKVLAPHASHALLLMVFLYVPAVHSVHDPTLGPAKPALQVQSACLLLASGP